MKYLNISDARAHLQSLIDNLAQEDLVITRRGKPVAKLVRYRDKRQRKSRYPLRGLPLKVAKDFDEPLPPLWETQELIEVAYEAGRGIRARLGYVSPASAQVLLSGRHSDQLVQSKKALR
jgi:prevent-host-death family protein